MKIVKDVRICLPEILPFICLQDIKNDKLDYALLALVL